MRKRTRHRRKEEEILNQLADLFEGLRRQSEMGKPILVEGTKDEQVLRRLRIPGEILKYSELGERKTISLLEGSGNRVILLTDFANAGNEIAERVEEAALTGGFKIDKLTRRRLFELARNITSELEGLGKVVERLRRQRLLGTTRSKPTLWL